VVSPEGRVSPSTDTLSLRLLHRGWIPDRVVRWRIRRLLRMRLRELSEGGKEAADARRRAFVAAMNASPIALHADDANNQHYRVPPRFFELVLGPQLKYSASYWSEDVASLAGAETAMLNLTVERARIRDGHHILDLGCGWGSLSLLLAKRFPGARVTGVSNSPDQKAFIESRAAAQGLSNLRIVTADMNVFDGAGGQYDRVVSVEMFEHMRNWRALLDRVALWLSPGGLLFIHVFTHREHAYPFEVRDQTDWMAKHFFTGGMMPSHDLLLEFQDPFRLLDRWEVSGVHYAKTAEAWLANLDRNRAEALEVLRGAHGASAPERLSMWRVFFMACAELWRFRRGRVWQVSHYLMGRP
jgi:cyclopropane-fatty-acyl-phospholipid synthase